MSVAIPIPLLQHLPDVNVTPGVGVDEYALVWDNDTARFVLRAPFAGILATGATVGATAQAQAFTLGVVSPFNAPAADSTTAWQVRKADKTTSVLNVDTTNSRVGIGATPAYTLDVAGNFNLSSGSAIHINTNKCLWNNGGSTFEFGWPAYGEHFSAVLNGQLNLYTAGAVRLTVAQDGKVGIGATPAARLHVDQPNTIGAIPVLTVDQADVSEEFIRFIGTSTTDASQSLVDAANMTTPGLLKGWLKIYVQDDQATDPITNAAYYVPFYAAPTA